MSSANIPPPFDRLLSTDLPGPVKAFAGLAIAVTRDLPDKLSRFPMDALTTLASRSLKLQQQYAEYVALGDELITTLRGVPDDTPEWATFDEDEEHEEAAIAEPTDDGTSDAPISGYDTLTIPQLRARLRSFDEDTVTGLVAYEEANAARPPVLVMLRSRLETLRAQDS